jgi:DNA polymerase
MLKHILALDFETFYDPKTGYSLRGMTPPQYILDKRFQTILLAAFDRTWDAPRIIPAEDIPAFLAQYPPEETVAVSYNALFDGAILAWRYGWVPKLSIDALGMVRALRRYERNSLEAVVEKLFGRKIDKSTIGKVAGLNAQGIKQAGLWPTFCTYAMTDVRECWHIFCKLCPEFPPEEARIMDLVLRAALQPVLHADVAMLQAHLDDLRREKAKLLTQCGYDKAALMSADMFGRALTSLGVDIRTKPSPANPERQIPAFAKTDSFMSELLEHEDNRVQVLASARLSHKSTIEETRTERFLDIATLSWGSSSRTMHSAPLLPMPLRYGGALTHRLSGEWKMNVQNLPRDVSKSKLRAALCAPPEHKLVTGDLAQIEARIVATLAGQTGLVEQFRRSDDVYAVFASAVFDRSVTKKDQPFERFIGKTAILGLGYGCGHERFYKMVITQARQSDIPLRNFFSEEAAERTVKTYRYMFNRIPRLWRQLDHCLKSVINNPNQDQQRKWPDLDVGPLVIKSGRIELPNGMALIYERGDKTLYGAKLLENITQALARVAIMQVAVRLAKRGYRFVLQAHDELAFVVPDDQVDTLKSILKDEMTKPPDWLPELPLNVDIGVGDNYGACK